MSRIEEALRRAGLAQAEPFVAPESGVVVSAHEDRHGPAANEIDERVAVPAFPVTAVRDRALPAAIEVEERESAVLTRPSIHMNEKLVVSEAAQPVAIEQYRRLATALHQAQVERGVKTVMVASAMAGEGKTLTAANLALTLSESFRRSVLLIDADLRRPTLHMLFDVPNDAGLIDGLNGAEERKLALVEASPRLTILPAGRPDRDPMAGLVSPRMRTILEQAGAKFDWVVIDTPPVGLLSDAKLLAEMVDVVVLVVGAAAAPSALIKRAVDTIGRHRIAGVVLNRAVELQASYNYYGYYATRASRS
jgi:protein-tyrosine kinase